MYVFHKLFCFKSLGKFCLDVVNLNESIDIISTCITLSYRYIILISDFFDYRLQFELLNAYAVYDNYHRVTISTRYSPRKLISYYINGIRSTFTNIQIRVVISDNFVFSELTAQWSVQKGLIRLKMH